MLQVLKTPVRYARRYARKVSVAHAVKQRLGPSIAHHHFDSASFKRKIRNFLAAMQMDDWGIRYRYSDDCTEPTLYASAYACMSLCLLGDLQRLPATLKKAWIDYFDSFQHPDDGLFHDPVVANDVYAASDWWGARHLALHMIVAYTSLGGRPRHPFRFLDAYCGGGQIASWLDEFDWISDTLGDLDVDNKIMNVGCLMQYRRDFWGDPVAGEAVDELKRYLRSKLNPVTGMWGGFNPDLPEQRSRMVQFAYHLLPLFFYDGDFAFDNGRIVAHALATQNRFGGYGVVPNSSACEDIDSIDLLVRLYQHVGEVEKKAIDGSLEKAFRWVLTNQCDDGGFVFRLFEAMKYGHQQMSSSRNRGAMFPTWFRLLSVAYMRNRFSGDFTIVRAPGLVYG